LLAAGWAASVHASTWSDRCEDFAIVGWYLYRQEAALAAAYRVKGYAHASREYFGVVAGFLLGHEAVPSPSHSALATTKIVKRSGLFDMTLF
jgi:hypothetical protein